MRQLLSEFIGDFKYEMKSISLVTSCGKFDVSPFIGASQSAPLFSSQGTDQGVGHFKAVSIAKSFQCTGMFAP